MPESNRVLTAERDTGQHGEADVSGAGGAGFDKITFEGKEVDLEQLADYVYKLICSETRLERARLGTFR